MLKKSAPIGMITVILLVALALMGVAYGAWTDRLNIGGTVNTGKLSVSFDNSENGVLYASGTSTCDQEFSADGKSVTLTLTNGFPGFDCPLPLDIVNNGSINVKLSQPTLLWGDSNWVSMAPLSGSDLSPYNYIMPGQHAYTSLDVVVPDNAAQNATGTFSFKIDASQ
jgi:hypothetical protein